MQRYFFNVHDRDGLLADPEGIERKDAHAARCAAIEFVRSILAEDVTQGFVDLNGRIEVITAGGEIVDVLAYAECVLFLPEGRLLANSRCSA